MGEGKARYEKEVVKNRPPLAELLEQFPSCKVPLAQLVQMLPPLQPRYYSIASAPSTHPSEIHVAFSLVRYAVEHPDSKSIERKGLCTNWLYRECATRQLIENDYLASK